MNLCIDFPEINLAYIYYCEANLSNVHLNGLFSKLLYLHPCFSLNGIVLKLPLQISDFIVSSSSSSSTTVLVCPSETYTPFISEMEKMEKELLSFMTIPKKVPKYQLYKQLTTENKMITIPLKVQHTTHIHPTKYILLKIHGIWQTETEYGISFDFLLGTNFI
jgi:hypothetical protein